jgi:molybdopterin biosynthesis enzyme
VITGNEVFSGLIDDKFAPIIRKKLQNYDCSIMGIAFAPDDRQRSAAEINQYLQAGAEMIVVAGGMSVDPDDITRVAIADAGAEDVVYGTPVLPGAMFLYGRFGDVPVMGLPACVLFFRATVLDLILPRVLAGEPITREDIASMAHGGMCLECEPCHFPRCPFGK